MAARKRIRENQENGQLLKETLNECKKITVGYMFKAGSCLIGQTIFDIQKEIVAKKKEDDEKRINKANGDLVKVIVDVIAVRALNLDLKR